MKWPVIFLLGLSVAACSVAPRIVLPPITLPPVPVPQDFAPVHGPDQLAQLAPVPVQWWRTFGNTDLDALVEEALHHETDIAVADATLRQAREQGAAAAGAALPQVDASYQAQRTRVSNALAPAVTDATQQLYTLHTTQVTVSYGLDLFGGTHARIRSANAAAEDQRHRFDAARTTVITNLVQAVIQRATLAA